nr:TetR/AcrR family transcriptional regulator C-terminal domain-containing protein [Pseudoclavibacter chungangensis]
MLAAVADVIVADDDDRLEDDWRVAALTEARALRTRLLAVTDGAELVASALALGLGGGAAALRLRTVFARRGFEPDAARRAGAALVHFVLGHTAVEQQRAQARALGVDMADADAADAVAPADEAAFELGLRALVRGLGADEHDVGTD